MSELRVMQSKKDTDAVKDLLDDAIGLYKNIYRVQLGTKRNPELIAQAGQRVGESLGLLCREIAQRELINE